MTTSSKILRLSLIGTVSGVALALCFPAHAQTAMPTTTKSSEAEVVIVVGSRSRESRSSLETAAPVDVIGTETLAQTGQTEISQMINFVAPSFNSAKQTISNGTDHIDPATLRGLGPDQSLVLVNGKRQHTTALVNVNSTVGRGSVGYDMNVIPPAAIKRIEVLRDGAAAQYGSDAIAGVINIALNNADHGVSIRQQGGAMKEGDGENYTASVNAGFKLGDEGFVNATLAYGLREATDRSGVYNNTVYLAPLPATRFTTPLTPAQLLLQQQDNALVTAAGFDRSAMIVGNARGESFSGFVNSGMPLGGDLELYSFGGLTKRYGEAAGFYRYPNSPRTSNLTLFPNGFLPVIETEISDVVGAIGIKRDGGGDDWSFDISTRYGSNRIAFDVTNSINASLGNASPTDFYAGALKFEQITSNADASRNFSGLFGTKSFNVAFGIEARIDRYSIEAGQVESYADYNAPNTPAANVRASGVQVFGGFRPSNETDEKRGSIGIYLDLESDLTERLLVGGAIRYENYSDFGQNVSGKLVSRFKVSDSIALRAGINRGFRAPSLHQSYFSSVSTQFITVNGVNQQREVTTVRNDSDIAQRLGIPALKPETSLSYSLGGTFSAGRAFSVTIDAYQIDIKDRIVVSGRFSSTIPQLATFFAGSSVTEAQFFTNAVDTKTKGIDIVATGTRVFGNDSRLTGTLAANFNETEIEGGAAGVRTPSQLAGFGETLLNREERGRIEVNQPKDKIIATLTYEIAKFRARIAATRFGEITTVAPQLVEQDQTFSAKVLTDISLGYQFSSSIEFTLGANNVFDIYPDLVADPRLNNDGTVPYSRFATQFGFNGASYYAGLNVKF